jgi:hypothetical protein
MYIVQYVCIPFLLMYAQLSLQKKQGTTSNQNITIVNIR